MKANSVRRKRADITSKIKTTHNLNIAVLCTIISVFLFSKSTLIYTRAELSEIFRVFFRKGVIDVIFYLHEVGKAGYYEIYKQGFVVSRQTFANLLKLLEDRGVVTREVIDDRPPRVNYSLSGKGKRVAEILESLGEVLS